MSESIDDKTVNKDKITQIGKALSYGMAVYRKLGFTPGEITGGLTAAVYAVMKSYGMSDMQISNSWHTMADQIRDRAFESNARPKH